MTERLKKIYYEISLFEKEELTKAKETGSFYTNYSVAYKIVGETLKWKTQEEILKWYFLEPANGCGIFVFALIEYLEESGLSKSEIEDIVNKRLVVVEIQCDIIVKFLELLRKYYLNDYDFSLGVFNASALELTRENIQGFLNAPEFKWFDFIFGNPPYGINDKVAKKRMEKEYGNLPNDIYGLFYIHCYSLLSEKWRLGFITPRSFYGIKTFQAVRNVILWDIISIINCPVSIFKNPISGISPSIETAIAVVEKNTEWKNYSLSKMESDFNVIDFWVVDRSDCVLFWNVVIWSEEIVWNIWLLRNLVNKRTYNVSDLFDSAMWIKTADNKKFVSTHKETPSHYPFIKGTSKYNQSFTTETEGYLSLGELLENKKPNTAIPQDKFLSLWVRRLGVPEIGHNGIVQAFIYADQYPSNSIWIYQVKKNAWEDWLFVLLWLLNSRIYRLFSQLYTSWFRIEKHSIDNFPICIYQDEKVFSDILYEVKRILSWKISVEEWCKNIDGFIEPFLYSDSRMRVY